MYTHTYMAASLTNKVYADHLPRVKSNPFIESIKIFKPIKHPEQPVDFSRLYQSDMPNEHLNDGLLYGSQISVSMGSTHGPQKHGMEEI